MLKTNSCTVSKGPLWMPYPVMYGVSSKATGFFSMPFRAAGISTGMRWSSAVGEGEGGGGQNQAFCFGIDSRVGARRTQTWHSLKSRRGFWRASFHQAPKLHCHLREKKKKKFFFLSVFLSSFPPHSEQELKRGRHQPDWKKKKKMASGLALVLDASTSTGPPSAAARTLHILVEFSNRQLPVVAGIQRACYF